MSLGWHNLRHWFIPPIVEAVTLEAADPSYEPAESGDGFEIAMFLPGGFLHEEPLNHYIVFRIPGFASTISVNAGYMLHHFIVSEAFGQAEVARIMKHYRKKLRMVQDVVKESSPDSAEKQGDDSQGT